MDQNFLHKKVFQKNNPGKPISSSLLSPGQQRHKSAGQFIKSVTYGGLDGLCTTLIIAVSAIGSNKSPNVVVAVGLASLIADGLGMAVADYLATKSDGEFMKEEEMREMEEIKNNYMAEKYQMITLYEEMGLEPKVSEEIVSIISQNQQGFLKIMMIQELQIIPGQQNPITNSIVTFFSFALFGIVPIIPFIIAKAIGHSTIELQIILATILAAILFLGVLGLAKAMVGVQKWYFAVPETIIIGAIASGAAFGVGMALKNGDT